MSISMKGFDVAEAMKEELIKETRRLKEKGIVPCLGIIRAGERPDDLAYERAAIKRLELIGGICRVTELSEQVTQQELEEAFDKINEDPDIHGVLLFRPLPKHLDENPLKERIMQQKDVDCLSLLNLAKVFAGDEKGYAPCTAQAVMEMLKFYHIDIAGKNVTIIGRSLVVGKPLSMLLLKENATVTICHTKTKNLTEICRNADILIAAAGKAGMVTEEMAGDGAVVIDVGINIGKDGKLCGDVDFENVQKKASFISPVPRGVGSVTSSVLAKHVVISAKKLEK